MGKQLHLAVNVQPSGTHQAGWRAPGGHPRGFIDLGFYREIAKHAERGTLDAIFLADYVAFQPESPRQPRWTLDPVVTLSALASITTHIGLIPSISTTLTQPYHVARVIASLDHLTGGRAGWNIVTSFDPNAGRNFGFAELPEKDVRYRRGEEFVNVVRSLWSSWDEGSLVLDRTTGAFIDTSKVHAIDHHGEFFDVAGPLQVPTPPQIQPVLFQAGGSDSGRDMAGRFADGVFASLLTVESARQYRRDLQRRAAVAGRNPGDVRLFPGVTVVAGETVQQAQAKRQALDDLAGVQRVRLETLAKTLNVPAGDLRLDAPLPASAFDQIDDKNRAAGFVQGLLGFFAGGTKTVNDFLREGSIGHRTLIGDAKAIADSFEEWLYAEAADGFVLMFDQSPAGLADFVDIVVPELRRRGLFRKAYRDGDTLSDLLGLAPRSRTVGAGLLTGNAA